MQCNQQCNAMNALASAVMHRISMSCKVVQRMLLQPTSCIHVESTCLISMSNLCLICMSCSCSCKVDRVVLDICAVMHTYVLDAHVGYVLDMCGDAHVGYMCMTSLGYMCITTHHVHHFIFCSCSCSSSDIHRWHAARAHSVTFAPIQNDPPRTPDRERMTPTCTSKGMPVRTILNGAQRHRLCAT